MTQPTPTSSQHAPSAAKLALLKRRCADAEILVEDLHRPDGSVAVSLQLNNGREKRTVVAGSERDLDRLLEVPFERFVFLGDYQAIASYSDGFLEAAVRPLGPIPLPPSLVYRRLFGVDSFGGGQGQFAPITLTATSKALPASITLGPMSRDLQVLATGRVPRQTAISVRIDGVEIKHHDATVVLLERLAQSLFFEIDMRLGIPLSLAKERASGIAPRPPKAAPQNVGDVRFPEYEYPAEPMSLYWYARSAIGMPLLQFLAYYQCLEFFFPTYSQAEIHRRLRNLLKDPTFNPTKDTDIGKLVSAISGRAGSGYWDERSQLRATLLECLDPSDLRGFLESLPDSEAIFVKQKTITDRRLSLANSSADLRQEVADRIYDIRCKIVHTKGESGAGGVELLLPFSKEAEHLAHDILLVQYVARRVLIAASSPMSP